MLSPQLRRNVHDLWSLFWTAGLSNPLVAIEQITYLLFIRQLESLDRERVKQGKRSIYDLTLAEDENDKRDAMLISDNEAEHTDLSAKAMLRASRGYEKCKWSYISETSNIDVPFIRDTVFAWLRSLEDRVGAKTNGNTTLGRIAGRLSDAYFVLDPNKTETLKQAIGKIDDLFKQLDTRSVNADIMGDIFEHLLEEVKESGKNGQFRTPRHVIRFMVEMLDPELRADVKILDPACGSGGFLINTLIHWQAQHTDKDILKLEWDGTAHEVLPVWPKRLGKNHNFGPNLHGYDNDRTMVRIAWMNLILHGLESPEIHQLDTLSRSLDDDKPESEKVSGTYDYILANPPFTGNVDEGDLSQNRDRFEFSGSGANAKSITTKSELLFVWLMLDLLKIGGRAAVIVPDGVLFGSTKAHKKLRRQLLFENTLECVVSLPANVFQPYSGVKTSILFFQKAGDPVMPGDDPRTREVWFYEITDEAFTLDQKRKQCPGQDNDLWDAQVKHGDWDAFRTGEKLKAREPSTSKDYHQPHYWQERWRSVDGETLKIFPNQAGNKDHTHALHELWPRDFPDFVKNGNGSRQYDETILAKVRPKFETVLKRVTVEAVKTSYGGADPEKALKAAQTRVRKVGTDLQKMVRENQKYALDREFGQFGINALKSVLKENADQVSAWVAEIPVKKRKRRRVIELGDTWDPVEELKPLLTEFAKLDGYDVWRRSLDIKSVGGKLQTGGDGEPERVKTLLSWIVPTRKWVERETWGIDPETEEEIKKPTHTKAGQLRKDYLAWLRDKLEVFDDDGTVKSEHLDRLDPDCLEALDLNLSAGRHKPFVFDPGDHDPPADLIRELQAIHSEVQERLGKLLTMVEGK